jgi:heme o synthase
MGEVNTWIGSLVGAVPPVMGYMAATGSDWSGIIHPEAIAVSSLLFLWQFPHFFSLSYMHREDYSKGM